MGGASVRLTRLCLAFLSSSGFSGKGPMQGARGRLEQFTVADPEIMTYTQTVTRSTRNPTPSIT